MIDPGALEADAPVAEGFAQSEPTPARRALSRFMHNPFGVVALAWLVLMILVAIFAPFIAPYGETEQIARPFLDPNADHLLGTDDLGRDLLSRLIYGARVSVRSGIQTAVMAMAIGVPLGLASGYAGGKVDVVIMRITDAVNSFPALILSLSIAAVLGPGLGNAMIAITIVLIPAFTRLTRATALAVTQETYVEASRSIGSKTRTILRKRIFPGVLSVLIVQASLIMGVAMIAEAGLSFLGLGVQAPDASWGAMLQRGFQSIFSEPYQMVVPGVAIGLAVLAFNNLGDALRDALGFQETRTRFGMKRGRLGMTSVASPASSPASPTDALLSVQHLSVEFATARGLSTVVDDVSFDVMPGEVVGLVGESGCGKSVTSTAIMRLIQTPPGRVKSGRVLFDGKDLLTMDFDELRETRGNDMSMVFQDPMSSINPAFTVGNLMVEAIRLHQNVPRQEAEKRAEELLDHVGIPDPRARLEEYPHRLSGGMRQRVLIAMALANEPKLLIADEPTTALDVTIQAQIIELLQRLQKEQNMSMIFVTHDLGIVAQICDRVVVMYAGQVVEEAPVHKLFAEPRHPYTKALLGSMPQTGISQTRLKAIPGRVPAPGAWPVGCRFASRCEFAIQACREAPVALLPVDDVRAARCIRHSEVVEAHR